MTFGDLELRTPYLPQQSVSASGQTVGYRSVELNCYGRLYVSDHLSLYSRSIDPLYVRQRSPDGF